MVAAHLIVGELRMGQCQFGTVRRQFSEVQFHKTVLDNVGVPGKGNVVIAVNSTIFAIVSVVTGLHVHNHFEIPAYSETVIHRS